MVGAKPGQYPGWICPDKTGCGGAGERTGWRALILLRDMERTLHSGQCIHGRPTYVELRQKDIEQLFGRTR